MRHSRVLVALSFVLTAASVRAQTANAAGDPISGTWTGDIGLDEESRTPITMQLRFDGSSVVAGTIAGPGQAEIKSGTFDPRTGAFKLEIDVQDDTRPRRFVFEGIAVKGMATGRVNSNNQTGTFRFTRGAAPASGAQPGGPAFPPELRLRFDEVSAWVTKAAQLVPADQYSYQPNQNVRSFGQLVAHIADSYNYYCGRPAGGQAQWTDAIEKGSPDKAAIVQKLAQSGAACATLYGGAGQAGSLIDNVAHTSLHYGNIVTYMRLLGLVPPSS
ncbi:MAG: DinB family protein [Gemmatimonadota bacterium]